MPPVTQVGMASLALIVAGGIYLSAHLPEAVPLTPAIVLLALGLLEPANIAVLFELKKPRPRPEVIERLMKRFIYTAGILGALQIATLVIMTKIASG